MLAWVAGSLAVLLVVIAAGGYLVYRHLSGNIKHEAVGSEIIGNRPTKDPGAVSSQNILLIGSDTRAGAGDAAGFGSEISGARSDTTVIVHLAAGARKATLVSIPRDSYVEIPACREPGGKVSTPHSEKFNAAFSIGGAACTIATVEHLTNLRIDHFVEVDFAGFQHMVNALGGVSVCVGSAINDPIVQAADGSYHGSGLTLPAGKDKLNGKQALGFVRARYALGDGSDLGRIKRQQEFLSAMIRKATSTGLLVDLPKLYGFLNAATKSLTTDPGFGLPQMRSLSNHLHGLKPGKVSLLTVPLADTDAYRVIGGLRASVVLWDTTRADALWQALRTDGPLPGTAPASPSPSPDASATTTPSGPTLVVAPQDVHVRVLNGNGQTGLATQVAQQLRNAGFDVVGIGDADSHGYATTVVRYGVTKNESSQTLAAAIPGAQRQLDAALDNTLTVVLGSDFHGVVPVHLSSPTAQPSAPTPTPTGSLDVTTADQDVCTA